MVDEIVGDELLVEGLRRGSSEAYAQLWQKYGDCLINFLQSLGADSDDAADVAVDGVARAVEKIDQFDPQKAKGRLPFRNWLFTIARHLWHDQQRSRKNIVYLDDEFRDTPFSPTTDEQPTPIADALNHALSTLPDNQRLTITMHFYDNLPLNQIAQIMNVPEGTIRQWKKRAIATLRSVLQEQHMFADFVDRE